MMGYRVLVYVYGTEETLTPIVAGESTDPLCELGFTMRSSITGIEFEAMTDIDIGVGGYLVDTDFELGDSSSIVWSWLGQ